MLAVNFALLWGIPMDACSFIEPPELTVMLTVCFGILWIDSHFKCWLYSNFIAL